MTLLLTVVGLLDTDYIWAVFPAVGGIIGVYFTIAFLADGSLTEFSGGASNVIASASTSGTSAWQFLSLIPIMLSLSSFLVAGYKVSKVF